MPTPADAPAPRLEVLDLARGLALGGMLLVHFQYYTSGGEGGAITAALGAVAGFLGSAYTLFGFVFGASFGLQLERSEAAGRPHASFAASMARRLLGLAAIGFLSEALTGYHVLNLYVLAGFGLLLVARASPRMLVLLAAACLLAEPATTLAVGAYQRAERGAAAAEAAAVARRGAYHRMLQEREQAKASGGYSALAALQARQVLARYADPWSYVPGETAALMLLGLAAAKKRALHALAGPRRRWLPWCAAAFAALGIAGVFFWDRWPSADLGFKPLTFAVGGAAGGVLSDRWLGFAVVAALAWLTTASPRAHAALSPVAAAGRMALTWYLLHIFGLELLLGGYWWQVPLTPLQGLAGAAALFAAMGAAAHLWLRRHRYGPVEWAWRAVAQGRPAAGERPATAR